MPKRLLVLALAVGGTVLALRTLSHPWPWLAGALGVAAISRLVSARKRLGRAGWALAALVALALGAIETILVLAPHLGQPTRFEGSYADVGAFGLHDDLGYAPEPGLALTSRKLVHDRAVYEVTYGYDTHALRTPPPVVTPPRGSVLCFGCSFTFGEGVEDTEAYPYRVGVRTGGKYQVLNFGFHGYGPHQMLARLQAGLVEPVLSVPPTDVVYLALTDHMTRAAGLKSWDAHGPWYTLEGEALVRKGNFDDRPWPAFGTRAFVRECVGRLFGRSALYARLRREPFRSNAEHERLFEALVRTTQAEVEMRFPGARFHVLAWDLNPGWNQVLDHLAAAGIEVHRVSEILPPPVEAHLIPGDLHPTPEALDRIAAFVVERLLSR